MVSALISINRFTVTLAVHAAERLWDADFPLIGGILSCSGPRSKVSYGYGPNYKW